MTFVMPGLVPVTLIWAAAATEPVNEAPSLGAVMHTWTVYAPDPGPLVTHGAEAPSEMRGARASPTSRPTTGPWRSVPVRRDAQARPRKAPRRDQPGRRGPPRSMLISQTDSGGAW